MFDPNSHSQSLLRMDDTDVDSDQIPTSFTSLLHHSDSNSLTNPLLYSSQYNPLLDPSSSPSLLSPNSFLPSYLFNNNFDINADFPSDPSPFPSHDSIFMPFVPQFPPSSPYPPIPNPFDALLPMSKVEFGPPPTLFHKRHNSKTSFDDTAGMQLGSKRKRTYDDEDEDEDDDILNYDSDEKLGGGGGGDYSNANNNTSTVTLGDEKGKKKGVPAKNLMAERRRRKKLNDRLYMLRSVVPKISKV